MPINFNFLKVKRFLIILIFSISSSAFAQTMEQLKQLQNMTPQQIEQLKKLQQQGGLDNDKTLPNVKNLGDRTPKIKTRTYTNQDSVRTNFGRPPLPDKYEKLLMAPGDSIRLTKEEYIDLMMRKDKDSITVFGRDIFRSDNLTFAPSLSIATPINYIISAGDELIMNMWGAAEAMHELKVSPEGNISIPNVGLINVGGLTVREAERQIKSKLINTVAGLGDGTVHVKITLGDIRSISVNIIGEAKRPGTYTLPSLATLFNALYSAGGVSDIGSLRNIKLYRGGKELATLDVYDYLLNGKQEVNVPLEDNDQIVVMPYENIVQVTGKVKRPKLYELKRDETAATLIDYAGGFAGDAYMENMAVSRRSGGRQFSMHTVTKPEFADFTMMDRDSVSVGEILQTYANRVKIEGAVWREGDYEMSDKIRTVGDLLRAAEGLSDDAFAGRAQIVRTKPDKTLQIISINAGKILTGEMEDIELRKDDQVIVTSVGDLREGQTITVKGEVNEPRIMPYADNMTIEDLIVLSKGLKESASLAHIEIARRIKNPSSKTSSAQKAEIFDFAIGADLSLTPEISAFTLQPYDEVYIRRSPGYSEQQIVTIQGEVLFTGEYVMATATDRLSDLVAKAGGLTPEAYVKGAYLKRQTTEYDMERIKSLQKLMQTSMQAAKSRGADTLVMDIVKLGDYYPVGIDLETALLDPKSDANLTLKQGDMLVVPTFNNTVKISGAVYYPTTTTFTPKLGIRKYIAKAGGYADRAERKPFVIYMNGTVASSVGGKRPVIAPGCEIVIPLKPPKDPSSAAQWVSIGTSLTTSVVSMTAMILSILPDSK